ncbi:MAG: L-histidine N(alpha)-methyltransferase [Candidatus Sericytochromatia bacterium]|uniref:L-histidine N(Alpha)-methyltransferase n=1 Tax=Candidatus Tanganyikabacteria bacterium TaxID=2961651 RepID=A0A937X4F6_9BACT|nr:L-histidine N(alpha)-methyltransferase [Candidatus Tanganyikabacteria bacterium]
MDAPDLLASDILAGFAKTPREIPCVYFYDAAGSEIYGEITRLPEYYPPRAETAILRAHAAEIATICGPGEWVELGAGSATRTRHLLSAVVECGWDLQFRATDASPAMLGTCVDALRQEYPGARIEGLVGDYFATLAALPPRADRSLVFLGGTIGNMTDAQAAELASAAARAVLPGGHFLVGFDRRPHAGKTVATIEQAYNDAAGVTARFNLNLLTRLNRELGADFDLARWRHEAPYNTESSRIEMNLVSQTRQQITIPAVGRTYEFAEGEQIRTEISRRFEAEPLAAMLEPFTLEKAWTDGAGLFGMALLGR